MAGKGKAKQSAVRLDDLSKPTQWRLQHGGFDRCHDTDPETGIVVTHHRSVDTLGMMLTNGTITQEMHDAGQLFRSLFRSAAFDSMSTSQILRVPGTRVDTLSTLQVDARRKITEALDALGGHASPAGSCVWFVVGLEFSIREWAARRGWAGRPVPGPVGQGVLVAGLGMLAMHFGLTPRSQAA